MKAALAKKAASAGGLSAKIMAFRLLARVTLKRYGIPQISHVYVRIFALLASFIIFFVAGVIWYPKVHPWWFLSFVYWPMGVLVWSLELSVCGMCCQCLPKKITKPLTRSEYKVVIYLLMGLTFIATSVFPLKREDKTLVNSLVLIGGACGGSMILLAALYMLNWSRMAEMDKEMNPGDLRMGAWKGRIGKDFGGAQQQSGKKGAGKPGKGEDVYVKM